MLSRGSLTKLLMPTKWYNNGMKIEFDKNFPEMIQDQIEAVLTDKTWILPKWMQRLYVGWCADDENSNATMQADKDYRFARLTVCGHFLTNSVERQHEIVYHEFIHTHISPLSDYAKEIVEKLCKDNEPLKDYLDRELVRRNEATTQDIAFAISEYQIKTKDAIKILETECLKAQSQIED